MDSLGCPLYNIYKAMSHIVHVQWCPWITMDFLGCPLYSLYKAMSYVVHIQRCPWITMDFLGCPLYNLYKAISYVIHVQCRVLSGPKIWGWGGGGGEHGRKSRTNGPPWRPRVCVWEGDVPPPAQRAGS